MGTEGKPQKEPMPDLRVAPVAILPRKRGTYCFEFDPNAWALVQNLGPDQIWVGRPKSQIWGRSRPTKFGPKIISPGRKSEPRKYVLKMKDKFKKNKDLSQKLWDVFIELIANLIMCFKQLIEFYSTQS